MLENQEVINTQTESDLEGGLLIEDSNIDLSEDKINDNEDDVSKSVEDSDSEEVSDDSEETNDDSDNDDDEKAKNYGEVDWIKKRLAQKDRQAKRNLREKEREISDLRNQVSAIYQPINQEMNAPVDGEIFDPSLGRYVDENSVEGQVVKKIQQMKQSEVIQKQQLELKSQLQSFGEKIDEVKDKYEDYEDVVKQAQPYLSQTMVETMIASPSSVDVFYNVFKDSPEKIIEISKLPPGKQIKAMNFLEFQMENKVQQKLKSNAPKPISPVKPSANNFVDDGSYEAILRKHREKQKRQFGDR